MQQPAGGARREDVRRRQCNNQPDKRYGRPWHDERRWRNEMQRRRHMGGVGMSRGDATTSRTRVIGGHGAARGDGRMRGGDAGRSEAAAFVEAT
jgi:hypothetical protein